MSLQKGIIALVCSFQFISISDPHYNNTGAIAYNNAYFGIGVGEIILKDVQCSGTELTLSDCTHTTLHFCLHTEDAGVSCCESM